MRATRIVMATATWAAVLGGAAHADVTISDHATKNMNCSAGVCTATAKKAVLNVGELQTMLGSGDVTVKTGSVTKDIAVDQPLGWTSTSRLILDAQASVIVNKPVTIEGQGAVTITTNDSGGSDGDLYFFRKGQLTFRNLSSSLVINGNTYLLDIDLKSLARDIDEHHGSGFFALATDDDVAHEVFKKVPIAEFKGTFEGLGHTISHLKLRGGDHYYQGMFGQALGATIRDIYLTQVDIKSGNRTFIGGLVGFNEAVIINASVDGAVGSSAKSVEVGGLVGDNQGSILRSRSGANVDCNGPGCALGGLVGRNYLFVDQSYATGRITGLGTVGGLIGSTNAYVTNCYATGSVTSAASSAGGLVGGINTRLDGGATPLSSYAMGLVLAQQIVGGFAGVDGTGKQLSLAYWDLDTSGITDPSQGAGNIANDPGITGLSDAELKSSLPEGFDSKVWAQDPNVNFGYPYLIENPPR